MISLFTDPVGENNSQNFFDVSNSPARKIGLAICGYGVAGQARAKACADFDDVDLRGIVSRRAEVGTLTWREALQNTEIDAVAVSTENSTHGELVAEALQAGKHVLCDYPLSCRAGEAQQLFALAASQSRVLHAEHIGLLTQEHRELREQAKQVGALRRGEYRFQASWNAKTSDVARTGPHRLSALPRLLQIADLWGEFRIQPRWEKESAQGYELHLHLEFPDGGVLGFTEERMAGLTRRRTLAAECEHGGIHWKPAFPHGENLFAQDLAWFRDRILGKKNQYYREETMVGILEALLKI